MLLSCDPGDLNAILTIVDSHDNTLNAADCALAWKCLTTRGPQPFSSSLRATNLLSSMHLLYLSQDKRFECLIRRTRDLIPDLEPRELAGVLRTLPRLLHMRGGGESAKGPGNEDFAERSKTHQERVARSQSRQLERQASKRMEAFVGSLYQVLRSRLTRSMGRLSAQDLALAVNALSKLPHPPASLSSRHRGGQQRKTQEKAGLETGRGEVGQGDFEAALVEAVSSRLDDFTPQGLALILTALPKLSHGISSTEPTGEGRSDPGFGQGPEDKAFLARYRDTVARKLASVPFLPQDLALLLNGFTNLGFHPGPEFLHQVSQRVQGVLPACKPQDLALMWNSYARLSWRPPAAHMSGMRERALATMPTYRPQDWSNTLQAMGKIHYSPGDAFLAEATRRMEAALSRFNPHTLVCTVNAFALLQYLPPLRFRLRLLSCVQEAVGALKVEELCILLHSIGQLPALAMAQGGLSGAEERGEMRSQFSHGENQDRNREDISSSSRLDTCSKGEREPIVPILVEALGGRLGSLRPNNLSLLLRALARIDLSPSTNFLREVEECVEASLTSFNGMEAALTLHALARLSPSKGGSGDDPAEEEERVGQRLQHGTCSPVIRALYEQVLSDRGHLGPQEVCLVLNSMVRLGRPGDEVVDGLCGQMELILSTSEQEGVVAAKAKEGSQSRSSSGGRPSRGHALFAVEEDGGRAEEEGSGSLSSQGLALLVGSFGHLAYLPSRRLQARLLHVLDCRLLDGSFAPRDISMSLRGLANIPSFRSGKRTGELAFVPTMTQKLVEALEGEGTFSLNLGPQDVAMVVNAFARMQMRADDHLLDNLAVSLLDRLPQSEGQALASVINAFARLRYHPGQGFLAAFEVEVRRRIATLDLSSLCLILWSLAVMESSACSSSSMPIRNGASGARREETDGTSASALSPALLEDAIAVRLLPELRAQLSRLELARSAVGKQIDSNEELDGIDAESQSSHLPGPSLALSGPTLSQRSRPSPPVPRLSPALLTRSLCQILQVLLYTSSCSFAPAELRDIPGSKALYSLVIRAWGHVAHLREPPVPSALHQQVMGTLTLAGVSYRAEEKVCEGTFSLDLVLFPRGNCRNCSSDRNKSVLDGEEASHSSRVALPLVVEVDGPSHYMVNMPDMLTGDTMFKRRMLLGQRSLRKDEGAHAPSQRWAAVLSLLLWEWEEVGPRHQNKIALLRRKLKAEGLRLEDYIS